MTLEINYIKRAMRSKQGQMIKVSDIRQKGLFQATIETKDIEVE